MRLKPPPAPPCQGESKFRSLYVSFCWTGFDLCWLILSGPVWQLDRSVGHQARRGVRSVMLVLNDNPNGCLGKEARILQGWVP